MSTTRAAPSSGDVINPRAAPSSGGVINPRAAPSSGRTEDESYEEFKNTSSLPFPAKGTVKSPEVDLYSTGGKKPPVFFSSPGGVRGWHRCLGSGMDQDVEPGSDQSFGSPATTFSRILALRLRRWMVIGTPGLPWL